MMKLTYRKSFQLSVVILSSVALSSSAHAGKAAEVAQTAAGAAMQVAVVSAATGTALKVPCFSTPPNTAACIMMGLAVAQVGMALMAKSGAKDSANALTGTYTYGDQGTVLNSDGTTSPISLTGGANNGAGGSGSNGANGSNGSSALAGGALGSLQNDYSKLQEAVTKAGVTVSEDGKTASMKNGKKGTAETFSSAAAMQKAGFGPNDISGVENALADAKLKAADRLKNLAALTNDVGGGGGRNGGDSAGSGGGGGGGGYDPYGSGAGDKNALRSGKSANIAGMSKKLGDDNIGVAGDDIFQMITRRYQARDKADNFIKDP